MPPNGTTGKSSSTTTTNYNSGTSGSKGGGASTQSPGAGGNAGTVGSKTSNNGASSKTGGGNSAGASGSKTSNNGSTPSSSSSKSPSTSNNSSPKSTGSGSIGSKGGGASTQKPGAGGGGGKVNASASPSVSRSRSPGPTTTNSSATKNGSGTASQWGGSSQPKSIQGMINEGYKGPPNAAAAYARDKLAASKSTGLRGTTGPAGEPRVQPATYGTAYQTSQRLRDAYPDQWGKYDQTAVTRGLMKLSQALPGEAHVSRYGTGAMPNLARVGLNQVTGGYGINKMLAGMDTTGLRSATLGFEEPGPRSMGMTDNWADPEQGKAYQTLAMNAIGDALDNRGVSPQAQNATNFVAAGTPMVRGVNEVGAPVNGTQFGIDPTNGWKSRVASANQQAALNLQAPFQGAVGSTGLNAVDTADTPSVPAVNPRPEVQGPPRPWANPTPIPAPQGMVNGMMGAPNDMMRDPAAARAAGLTQSAQPTAPTEEAQAPPGYFSQFAMTPDDMSNMKKQAMQDFSFNELMTMRQNQDMLPGFMGPITRDQTRMANAPQAAAPPTPNMRPPSQNMQMPPQSATSLPAPPSFSDQGVKKSIPGWSPPQQGRTLVGVVNGNTISPQWSNSDDGMAGANPQSAPEDVPNYSDNPIQGASNPSQEPEDPRAVKDRQYKYAEVGGTIGGVVAGPLGTIVGATLGYQMGKTSPGQRAYIANDPNALRANANSINQMVRDRGGGGNRDMFVTEPGLKTVLTNPKIITTSPQQYTTLEQMLAALAQGINPETGKPV